MSRLEIYITALRSQVQNCWLKQLAQYYQVIFVHRNKFYPVSQNDIEKNSKNKKGALQNKLG